MVINQGYRTNTIRYNRIRNKFDDYEKNPVTSMHNKPNKDRYKRKKKKKPNKDSWDLRKIM